MFDLQMFKLGYVSEQDDARGKRDHTYRFQSSLLKVTGWFKE